MRGGEGVIRPSHVFVRVPDWMAKRVAIAALLQRKGELRTGPACGHFQDQQITRYSNLSANGSRADSCARNQGVLIKRQGPRALRPYAQRDKPGAFQMADIPLDLQKSANNGGAPEFPGRLGKTPDQEAGSAARRAGQGRCGGCSRGGVLIVKAAA